MPTSIKIKGASERESNGTMANHDTDDTYSRLFPSTRLTITIMMLFACLLTYMLRLNMGFAMVCMIKSSPSVISATGNLTISNTSMNGYDSYNKENDKCKVDVSNYHSTNSSGKDKESGEFTWEKSLQGVLLGAFFYGYIVTQVPSGWLCDRFGAKIVLGIGLGTVSVLTLALPEAGRSSPYAMLVVRIIQGMFAAVSFPAIHTSGLPLLKWVC